MLARIRSGTPPDLAWVEACREVSCFEPELALAWGGSIWGEGGAGEGGRPSWLESGLGKELLSWGQGLRQALSVSVWEGRPCLDRMESSLRQLRSGCQAVVDADLQRLSIRSLLPLFLCSAPAVLGLIAFGLILTWGEAT